MKIINYSHCGTIGETTKTLLEIINQILKKKFQKIMNSVNECEKEKPGFWEMIKVENLKTKFNRPIKLEKQIWQKITVQIMIIDNVLGIYNPLPFLKRYTYCKLIECCDDNHIIGDTRELERLLQQKLYGQHLAQKVVVDALSAHFMEKSPQKALTLSFHGWPGSGKNYVTKFIKKTMYKEGKKSTFIHEFTARVHFPLASKVEEYKMNLQNWIKGNVTNCERSLFIFDEVDKMPENVLNAIKPFIDYYDSIENVDYRKSVFIFLSNTGGTIIKDHLLTLWEQGVKRKDVQLSDFEHIITKGAFNEEGGFHYSDTIKSNLIDHYIPFLPMEKEHVELCIRDQFKLRSIQYPTQKLIDEVMEFVEWGPEPLNLFSTTGCKRLSQKVPLVIHKYKLATYSSRNEEL